MFLEVVPIAENGTSKVLPKKRRALRVFLILFDGPRPQAAVSGGYTT